MGQIYLAVALLSVMLPAAAAAFIYDLTRRQAAALFSLAAIATGGFWLYRSEWFETIWWNHAVPPPTLGEARFIRSVGEAAAANPDSRRTPCIHADDPRDWPGRIESIVRRTGGVPAVDIRIAPNLHLHNLISTHPNGSDTTGTTSWNDTLTIGDLVRVSAVFYRDDNACVAFSPESFDLTDVPVAVIVERIIRK